MIFRKDVPQKRALIKAARVSSKRAFSGSKVLGLSVSFIKNGVVYEEDANGNVIIVNPIEPSTDTPFKIEKGLILLAK